MPLTDRSFDVNGIRLHAVEAGSPANPLVLLLHGFPEFWFGWRKQFDPLAENFHVVAPDQRGYNLSDKPRGIGAYNIDLLAGDVAALVRACGHDRVSLVGHDWGGMVAWWTAMRYPDLVRKLAILNAPHPMALRRYLRRSLGQLLRSWYAGFLQIPVVPELTLRAGNFSVLVRALRGSSLPATFSDEDFNRYREAWSRPGALTAMINWYRSFARYPSSEAVRVHPPVLILWGARDDALKPQLARESARLCNNVELIYFPDSTHWIQHEEPDAVNECLIRFFSS